MERSLPGLSFSTSQKLVSDIKHISVLFFQRRDECFSSQRTSFENTFSSQYLILLRRERHLAFYYMLSQSIQGSRYIRQKHQNSRSMYNMLSITSAFRCFLWPVKGVIAVFGSASHLALMMIQVAVNCATITLSYNI